MHRGVSPKPPQRAIAALASSQSPPVLDEANAAVINRPCQRQFCYRITLSVSLMAWIALGRAMNEGEIPMPKNTRKVEDHCRRASAV